MATSPSPLQSLSDATAAAVATASPFVVAVNGRDRGNSSGFLWRPGLVVTAHEALDRDDDLTVTLADGRSVPATIVGRDPSTDVALLRIEETDPGSPFPAATADLKAGQLVLAIGRSDANPLAALGMVALVGESWRSRQGGRIYALLRLDISLPHRIEGGAVFAADGTFAGMAVFGPRRSVLVIPAATVERVASRILDKGSFGRGYLGLALQSVGVSKDGQRGVMVMGVDADGPASKAGILQGDVIVTANGQPVGGVRGLLEQLDPETVGQPLALEILRAGTRTPVTVIVGERPRG
jgi:S1-C subfamily serine protease